MIEVHKVVTTTCDENGKEIDSKDIIVELRYPTLDDMNKDRKAMCKNHGATLPKGYRCRIYFTYKEIPE